jgi:beta-N-acetylhexosaminidase
MDAEWGTAMRINDQVRFPYAYTIGAANDTTLSERLASMMAQECKELGVHINFAPVADINSNPNNPVIGFRSFGENQHLVSQHVSAFVRGLEKNGVLSCLKHFPGHGDTDKDSHLELPTVSHSKQQFYESNFSPFLAGIKAGSSSVMVGHLNVPNLDDAKTPSSLSKKVIQDELVKRLNFKGLIISDALNMKGVTNQFGKTEVVIKAFEAGNDILLYPESVEEAINEIANRVKKGKISETEINQRCLKILKAKFHVLNFSKSTKKFTSEDIELEKRKCYEKASVLIKNVNQLLPLKVDETKKAFVSIGANDSFYKEMIKKFQ